MSLIGAAFSPLRPMNALVRPAGNLVRPVVVALRPGMPRLLVQMADDVHSMAISTRELT